MADVLFKIVTIEGNGAVEPFVSERAVPGEFAKGLIELLNEEGLEAARKILKAVTPHQYIDSEIFAIVKSFMGERMREDEVEGTASIPYVALDKRGRGEAVDRIDVAFEDAEAVNKLAWENYGETVKGVAQRAGLEPHEARQVVDEIVKYLY